MASYCPESLKYLCGVRIAYLMWTCQDIYSKMFNVFIFHGIAGLLSHEVSKLALPKPCQQIIQKYINFSGRQLIPLIHVWGSKTELEYYQGNYLKNMMYENLVLNSDKLLNPRKMAEKILASRKLPIDFAFRLACVNFLENEVYSLWMDVQQYFLNPMVFTEESEEVVLWIYYCLLKMNSTSALNFSEKKFFFFQYCSVYCAVSGNVAYFDYLKSCGSGTVPYSNVDLVRHILSQSRCLSQLDHHQPCVIFYIKLLSLEEKAEIFAEFPNKMVHLYLNMPLSETFVENPEEIWKLIPDAYKGLVFVKIFTYFYGNNEDEMFEYRFEQKYTIDGNYSTEHLTKIWNCLWNISSDSHKLNVLYGFVFRSLSKYVVRSLFLIQFASSILKENLLHLFLSNGKAVFELYQGPKLNQSLINLISKYLPDDFRELSLRYFKETPKNKKKYPDPYQFLIPRESALPDREMLLNYIIEMLPSNSD